MYVRDRPRFKKGAHILGALLLASSLLVQGRARGEAPAGKATPAPRHWLEVRVDPPRFVLARGQAFELARLLSALATRLAGWKLQVVRAGQVHDRGAVWRLQVHAIGGGHAHRRVRALRVTFFDPEGRQVMLRRVPLGRYRSYDLAHTISLSTLEALVAVLDPVKFPGLAPPEQPYPASAPRSMPASRPVIASPPPMSPPPPGRSLRWALGLHGQGRGLVPGDELQLGGGLDARVEGGRWLVLLAFDAWAPLVAKGAGYDLSVQLLTLTLGGGTRHRVGRWVFAATVGPALRIAAEERRGDEVVSGSTWRAFAGFAGRLQLGLRLTSWVEIELFFNMINVFPYPSYTLHGVGVLKVGSTTAGAGLGIVLGF